VGSAVNRREPKRIVARSIGRSRSRRASDSTGCCIRRNPDRKLSALANPSVASQLASRNVTQVVERDLSQFIADSARDQT